MALNPVRQLISGKSACPDGKVHRWPERSSNASHTFGAAAVRKCIEGAESTVVTFYADVYGKRTGELEYPGEDWDQAMQRLHEAGSDRSRAYDVLDRLVEAFGHTSLRTQVTIDPTAPVESQVQLIQDAPGGGKRMVTDSIASAEAFIVAAQQGEFSTEQLLEATEFVPASLYYSQANS